MPDHPDPADLAQVDPAQFIATRNALVKRLRSEGRRDQAAEVGKMRRPPVTAWALNQVARQQPGLIADVLDAGGRLRSAMEQAVAGDASGLRDAQTTQRRAVDAAVAAAVVRLEQAGHPVGDGVRQRMVDTLGAAAVDDAVAAQVRDGVLDDDRSAPGFGLDAVSIPGRPPPHRRSPGAGAGAKAPDRPSPRTRRDAGAPERGRQGGSPAEQGDPDHDDAAARERKRQEAADERQRRREREATERERGRLARVRRAELKAQADRLARRAERLRAQADEAEGQAAIARHSADEAEAEAAAARRAAELAASGTI